jgi:hypothetical protein
MAETLFTIGFHGSMSSVRSLEFTCNENEINLNAKLKSLDTVLKPGGQKITEAVFVKQQGRAGLGQLEIKKTVAGDSPTFTGKAFILTQPVNVSVFRST